MQDLAKRDYNIRLFETYENILTENQKEYFKNYYFFDMSLQEIAENFNISRNAVYDQIKRTVANLEYYEEKLHLLKIKELLQEIKENVDVQTKEKIEELI